LVPGARDLTRLRPAWWPADRAARACCPGEQLVCPGGQVVAPGFPGEQAGTRFSRQARAYPARLRRPSL